MKAWPVIFVMSPGGNADLGPIRDYLVKNQYIAVLLDEAKNGPWEPIVGNFLAAHDDVIQRVRVAEGKNMPPVNRAERGLVRSLCNCPTVSCGLILQAAGPASDEKGNYTVTGLKRNAKLRIAMTMGDTDFNKNESDRMRTLFGKQRLSIF